jgi:hypothetical protein
VARALGVEESRIARFERGQELRARTSARWRAAGPAATELEQVRDWLFAEIMDLLVLFVAYRVASQPAVEAFADLARVDSRRRAPRQSLLHRGQRGTRRQ